LTGPLTVQIDVQCTRPHVLRLLLAANGRGKEDQTDQEGREELGDFHVATLPKALKGP
jgi:hypothetical protein